MIMPESKDPVVNCPYCGKRAEWVNNEVIYGRRYGNSWKAYLCRPCNAYVGCHQNSKIPKGTLANKETRDWRIKAHAAFDVLWHGDNKLRGKLYAEMADHFNMNVHIGSATPEQCIKIIEWAKQRQKGVKS